MMRSGKGLIGQSGAGKALHQLTMSCWGTSGRRLSGVSMVASKEPSASVLFITRSCVCVIRTLQEALEGQKKCDGTLHESCVRVGQKGFIFLPIRFETYFMA